MKLRLFVFAALAIMAAGCKPAWKVSPNGLKYKIFKKGNGTLPKVDDAVKFDYQVKNDKDSVLMSSYKEHQPAMVRLRKPVVKSDIMEGLAMLSVGDSGIFELPADSFFKGYDRISYKKGSKITISVKMEEIKSSADVQKDMEKKRAEMMKKMDEAKAKEAGDMQEYVKKNYPNAQKTDSGIYYVITKPGTGPKPKDGQKITAHYKGMFLDGKVFDEDRGHPFDFTMGSHQVIPGWEMGFAQLNKGAKATLIIPSKYAYGPGGNGMPPYATLVFEVELIDIQ